jgi:hypothetical protein
VRNRYCLSLSTSGIQTGFFCDNPYHTCSLNSLPDGHPGFNFGLEKASWHIFKLVFSELQRAHTVWVWNSSLYTIALEQYRLLCLLTWNIVRNFDIWLVTDILYTCSQQVRLKDCKFSDSCNFSYCHVFMCPSNFDIASWNIKIHAALTWTLYTVALYLKFCHLVFRFQYRHW